MADSGKIYYVNGMKLTKTQMVAKGIELCLMGNDTSKYEAQCDVCPYFDPDIETFKCKEGLLEDALELLKERFPDENKYQYKTEHTDCIWYNNDNWNQCPSTCSQYRDGWNDAMDFVFKGGRGYRPYKRQ